MRERNLEIYRLRIDGYKFRQIAEIYNISTDTARKIYMSVVREQNISHIWRQFKADNLQLALINIRYICLELRQILEP